MPSKASFSSLINSETPVLLDFYADWCGPCKAFAPVLDNLKADLGNEVKVYKINIDKNPGLTKKLDVMGVPTVMLYKDGDLKWQASGRQTMDALKHQIDKLN